MPADRSFAGGGSSQRIKTNNKIDLRDNGAAIALYDATLADVWFYYHDGDNKYVKSKAEAVGQRVKLTWTLDGSNIALKDDLPVKFGDRSLYTARCKGITGQSAADADLEKAVGTKCEITVETVERTPKGGGAAYWWAEVKEVRSLQRAKARPPANAAPAPEISPDRDIDRHDQQQERTAAQAAVFLDQLLSQIPLPIAQQIRALAKWANLTDAQLATKIGFFSGRAPLAIEQVDELKAKIKAERAA